MFTVIRFAAFATVQPAAGDTIDVELSDHVAVAMICNVNAVVPVKKRGMIGAAVPSAVESAMLESVTHRFVPVLHLPVVQFPSTVHGWSWPHAVLVPTHLPLALHVVFVVHVKPSSHAVPVPAAVFVQAPVVASQESAVHGL